MLQIASQVFSGFSACFFETCSTLLRQLFESASTVVRVGFDNPSSRGRRTNEQNPSQSRTMR